jgi:hypothetical protein
VIIYPQKTNRHRRQGYMPRQTNIFNFVRFAQNRNVENWEPTPAVWVPSFHYSIIVIAKNSGQIKNLYF